MNENLPLALSFDDKINAWTHGIGSLLSIIGLSVLFTYPSQSLRGVEWLAYGVFGLSMVAVYVSSTIYHATIYPKWRRLWKRCDHAAIFYLIAGTYTPFCLLTIASPEAHQLLSWVWILALIGSIAELFFAGRAPWLSTLFYLALGWLVIWEWPMFSSEIPNSLLFWIITGGICYSSGTIFYLWRSLPYQHAVWHLFVLVGSACHYIAVLLTIQ